MPGSSVFFSRSGESALVVGEVVQAGGAVRRDVHADDPALVAVDATVGLLEAMLTEKCSCKGIGRRLLAGTVPWLLGAGPQAMPNRSDP